MASASFLGGLPEKEPISNGLPTFNSAIEEKKQLGSLCNSNSWLASVSVPIPGTRNTRLRLPLLKLSRLHQSSTRRFGRRRGTAVLLFSLLCFVYLVLAAHRRFAHGDKSWPTPFPDPSTLVYRREDIQKIWEWEIAAGHYPSRRKCELYFPL